MNLSIVIPCYRSPGALAELVADLDALVQSTSIAESIEVILVNDGSPGDTGQLVDDLAARHAPVRALHLRRNYGQHNALLAGIREATGDVIVTMDDDGQHRADQIPALLAELASPAQPDLVYGIASREEHGFVRSLASRTVKAALTTVGVENAKWVSAFRAFHADVRDAFAEARDSTVNMDVLLSWATNRVAAVNVEMEERREGTSGYSFAKLLRHSFNMVTGYSAFPLKVASWIGALAGSLGVILLIVVLVQYFIGTTTVAGFTTTIAVIAIFSGAQLAAIGLIGEYLGRQHFRAMRKPTYVVRRR